LLERVGGQRIRRTRATTTGRSAASVLDKIVRATQVICAFERRIMVIRGILRFDQTRKNENGVAIAHAYPEKLSRSRIE